jgi:uncharacterized Fe-S cluster protein YjdI/CDGSH-type Zn-finger protein
MEPTGKLRHYADQRIDISYDGRRCIHAAECVRRLPAVFDSTRRPWIMASEASAEEIAEVIARCPSGALHLKRQDSGPRETPDDPVTIEPTPGGPLYVRGLVRLRSADGESAFEDIRIALCRCGQSHNKPFCDNSHLDSGFDDPGIVSGTPDAF